MDRRVVKTKKAIRIAFAELLSEKDINDITVKDIADAADINRKTFYNYYAGVHQVIDEIENGIVDEFEEALRGIDYEKAMHHPEIIFEHITEILNKDLDLYSRLFRAKKNTSLMIKMQNVMTELAKKNIVIHPDMDEITFETVIEYSFMGIFEIYHRWFNSDRKQSLDRLAQIAGTLCFEGINGLVKSVNK